MKHAYFLVLLALSIVPIYYFVSEGVMLEKWLFFSSMPPLLTIWFWYHVSKSGLFTIIDQVFYFLTLALMIYSSNLLIFGNLSGGDGLGGLFWVVSSPVFYGGGFLIWALFRFFRRVYWQHKGR